MLPEQLMRCGVAAGHAAISRAAVGGLAGGLGGGLTAALATPFDVIKVRMQTKVYATAADPFPSMPTVWRKTVAEAGWSALTRSAFTRVVSNAPSGAIMFTVYEGGVKYIEGRLEGRA